MGGSNVPQAFPNFSICLHFITLRTVVNVLIPDASHCVWSVIPQSAVRKDNTQQKQKQSGNVVRIA